MPVAFVNWAQIFNSLITHSQNLQRNAPGSLWHRKQPCSTDSIRGNTQNVIGDISRVESGTRAGEYCVRTVIGTHGGGRIPTAGRPPSGDTTSINIYAVWMILTCLSLLFPFSRTPVMPTLLYTHMGRALKGGNYECFQSTHHSDEHKGIRHQESTSSLRQHSVDLTLNAMSS